MNLKKYQPVIEAVSISVIVYLFHKLVFFLNDSNPKFHDFHFPIEIVYGFFLSCSAIILFILIKVKEKSIDNVGLTFLLITCIKMAISYAILSPILHSRNLNASTEKLNFFIVFAVFLAIETMLTIRILNNKQ
jgi:H+/Cl- antiporter ClcA